MKRHRLSILAGISTLLAIAIIAMWVRSYHHVSRFGFSTLRARWTFDSRDGSIALMTPPSAPWTADEAKAWDCVKRLRNEDIQWICVWRAGSRNVHPHPVEVLAKARDGSAASELIALKGVSYRPLLRALDGSKKFAAAHVVLVLRENADQARISGRVEGQVSGEISRYSALTGGETTMEGDYSGLGLTLHEKDVSRFLDPRIVWHVPALAGAVTINPAQLDRIRTSWHKKFDVELVVVPYVTFLIIALMLPVVWCRVVIQRTSRKRRGLCANCGYDLRASTGSCPECGTQQT